MDLVETIRAFVAVAEESSFTRGAARLGQPQPVASRKVAALEKHLGAQLLLRHSRSTELSRDGRRLLPLAIELLGRADAIAAAFDDSVQTLVIGVPEALSSRARAAVRRGLPLAQVEFLEGGPTDRRLALEQNIDSLALVPCAPDDAHINVPLGIAHHDHAPSRTFFLHRLRRSVRAREVRAIHLLVEDDVPAVRDPLRETCYSIGLRADQVGVVTATAEAWTRVFERDDVVVATAEEAASHQAAFSLLDEPRLHRSYRLEGEAVLTETQRRQLIGRLAEGLGGSVRCTA